MVSPSGSFQHLDRVADQTRSDHGDKFLAGAFLQVSWKHIIDRQHIWAAQSNPTLIGCKAIRHPQFIEMLADLAALIDRAPILDEPQEPVGRDAASGFSYRRAKRA